ncbi:GTP-binding protein Era [hydrothermal vent metagenome]|uniref:GTP-binding protein Era n=1 Tax=hydrothermal vent metagenome TaxID=652676 RepID=A0A3B0VIE7_9ZZZZ
MVFYKIMSFRSGFIAIVGRPNVGKSTLLNAILGEKLVIVSSKPQTTRNAVRGVKNLDGAQMVFVDTPGIHKGRGRMSEFMVGEALSLLGEVDIVLYMVDASRKVGEEEAFIMNKLRSVKAPVVLAINKVDTVAKESLLPLIARLSKRLEFADIIPVSARREDGTEQLLEILRGLLPEGPEYYSKDMITDQSERFLVGELIREKVFELTKEEIPYSVAVEIEEFKEAEDLVRIGAVINVERDSQKGIVIGKGGGMLKQVGSEARADIERLLGKKVFLKLFVKVTRDWSKKDRDLKEFGYK